MRPSVRARTPPLHQRAMRALVEFFRLEAAAGLLLIFAAVLALVCAKSPLASGYQAFRALPVAVGFGNWTLGKPALLATRGIA